MLVSDRLRNLFNGHGAHAPFRPWMEIRQDNGALLLVSQDGMRYKVCLPNLFVSSVMNESEYFSLYRRLGRELKRWPDPGRLNQKQVARLKQLYPKLNVFYSGVT